MTEAEVSEQCGEAWMLMGNRDFWMGDEARIQNVAKTIYHLYLEASLDSRGPAAATIKEFITRRLYMIGPRQRAGLSNAFDQCEYPL
jgi:hypothetical protein